jgi:hypothetical protein
MSRKSVTPVARPSVAVVIPLWRTELPPDEQRSLKSVRDVLRDDPRIFVAPQSLEISSNFLRGENVLRFPDHYFTYPHGYNRLLLSRGFFERLSAYQFVLVYQLDCLVLADRLHEWCARGYDYVGAPWHDDHGRAPGDKVWRVGNGGFSLRKVATALAVLGKRIRRGSLFAVPPVTMPQPAGLAWFVANLRHRLRQHCGLWTVEDELSACFCDNEDRFWALEAPKIWPDYRKPDVDEALDFAFEREPRVCLERTEGRLPFGCHAWAKHDREFWEQHLSRELDAPRV